MDDVDKKILEILKSDSRAHYVDIASKVGLTEGAVRRRVTKLKENGIIKRFTIETTAQVESVVG
ncbi:MAG: AsnC family transcriptional regulator, partial [Thermoplasmata archaeon]